MSHIHVSGRTRRGAGCVRLATVLLLSGLAAFAQEAVPEAGASGEPPARKPGEVRWHSADCRNGEILPGDRVVWYTGEFRDRNEGEVCAENEDGLFLEEFGVRVKNTVFIEMPRGDEDWSAVQAVWDEEEKLDWRAWEIERIAYCCAGKASPERDCVIGFLQELAARERPGLYRTPYLDNCLHCFESRAMRLERIARKKREARGSLQWKLLYYRKSILREAVWKVFHSAPGEGWSDPLAADFAAKTLLSRYDRACAEYGSALDFGRLMREGSFWTLVPRRLPEAAPVPVLPPDAAAQLAALAAAARETLEAARQTEASFPANGGLARSDALAAAAYESGKAPGFLSMEFGQEPIAAFSDFAVEAAWQAEVLLAGSGGGERSGRLSEIARLLVATMPFPEVPQFALLAVDSFPREPDAWRFAADLCAELLAKRPAASSGSEDWEEADPRTEDDRLDPSARRAVESIRTMFFSDVFRGWIGTLPPPEAALLCDEFSGRLGVPVLPAEVGE